MVFFPRLDQPVHWYEYLLTEKPAFLLVEHSLLGIKKVWDSPIEISKC